MTTNNKAARIEAADKAFAALQRFIDRKGVMRVPVHPDDDDLLISNVIQAYRDAPADPQPTASMPEVLRELRECFANARGILHLQFVLEAIDRAVLKVASVPVPVDGTRDWQRTEIIDVLYGFGHDGATAGKIADRIIALLPAQAPARCAPVRYEINYDEVICPACCHQFRSIPVNVQRELNALRDLDEKDPGDGGKLLRQVRSIAAEVRSRHDGLSWQAAIDAMVESLALLPAQAPADHIADAGNMVDMDELRNEISCTIQLSEDARDSAVQTAEKIVAILPRLPVKAQAPSDEAMTKSYRIQAENWRRVANQLADKIQEKQDPSDGGKLRRLRESLRLSEMPDGISAREHHEWVIVLVDRLLAEKPTPHEPFSREEIISQIGTILLGQVGEVKVQHLAERILDRVLEIQRGKPASEPAPKPDKTAPEAPPVENCATCRFSQPMPDWASGMCCRRYPPPMNYNALTSIPVDVEADHWCGEWRQR